tara:strand:- start:4986 stop:5594 length:609 start_codon:yes stop_codon:yes gene_type:complete
MKKILLFFYIITLISCNENKIKEQIEKAISTPFTNPPKLDVFNNVVQLETILTNKSTLKFTTWTKGNRWWSAHTPINLFGNHSMDNEYQNDLGFQIFGAEENYVNEIQLVLNISNLKEKKEALNHLAIFAEQTLFKLDIAIPDNLKIEILNDNQYFFENEFYYILLKKENRVENNQNMSGISELKLDEIVAIETRKLIIKSK